MRALLFALGLAVLSIGTALSQDAVIRIGDSVEIRLGGVPSEDTSLVSSSYQVDGQGFVNMPHIGKIRAAGSTQAGLQSAIEGAYKSQQIYTNPTVTVNVSSGARFVNVGGDVKAPQRVTFTPDLTVLSAINAAGGFTEYANQAKVRLLSDGKVTIIDVRKVREDPSKDVRLKPGDSIEVAQKFF